MKALLKTVLVAGAVLLVLAGTVSADERNMDYPHNSTNNVTCWTCHYTEASAVDWETAPTDIDDSPWNRLCWGCHNDTDAQYVKNHSSLATESLNHTWPVLREKDVDGVTTYSSVECRTCHFAHHQLQARSYYYDPETWENGWQFDSAVALFTGTVAAIDTTTVTVTGAGWTADQWVGYLVVPNTSDAWASLNGQYFSYNYKITGNTSDTLTVTGPIDSNLVAGSTMAIYYGKLIRAEIDTPNSGLKAVTFYDKTGTNSYADGDATYDGICEVCHTETTHFRNDGTGSEQVHENLRDTVGQTGTKEGTNCIDCHEHTGGLGHGGAGRKCVDCHGHDAGTTFDWDMAAPYSDSNPDPNFPSETTSIGAGSSHSHSTHTETDSDDAKGPGLYCDSCHDITKMPSFKSGTDSNGDGLFSLDETDVCNTCHSPGGTYDGVDDATVGAKTNWADGIYEADGVTLQTGKEKWCAACHDEVPSEIAAIPPGEETPVTVPAPNVVGDEDGSTLYGSGWGFYKTGHGLPKATTYPASGGLTSGAGKECLDCHDASVSHIDGLARTFDCTSVAEGGDDCDSDEYQQGYRLQLVDGEDPMEMPLVQAYDEEPNTGNYRLCFSSNGCHLPEKYLETGNDYGTSFRDDVGESPTALRSLTAPINAHEYHLNVVNFGLKFSADWRDPPSTYNNSNITCISCHNVHGSSQLAMIRTGDLIDKGVGMEMWYHKDGAGDPSATTLDESEGTYWSATSSANLCVVCHSSTLIYHRTPPAPQSAPTLAWTAETNYTADGVDPESGVSGTNFYFRVEYTDVNYDLPEVIQIWVDEDDSTTYEAGEKYDLLEVDAGDRNCSDGKLYKKILSIAYAGDGELNYQFYAADRNADATGDPTLAGKFITVSKVAPVLAWTDEDGYTTDGVSPNTAISGCDFTFRVQYTDSSDLAPTSIQVWVDSNDVSGYEGAEKIDLTGVDGGDSDYTDGKLYTTTLPLTYAGDGTFNYRFYASNDGDVTPATGTPTSDRTVTVNASNSAPLLSWIYAENYVRDGVDPDTGVDGDTFIFKVKYIDVDNDAPSSMQVWIDRNDDDDYEDVDEKIDMLPVDGDTDYSDGKLYAKSTTIAVAGDGVINYRFYASDGTLAATGTAANDSIVTLVVDAVTVTCPGESLQDAIDAASDGDTILVADGTCTEAIVIDGTTDAKNLTIRSVNGYANTTLSGGGTIPTVVTLLNGADPVLDGFTISGAAGLGYGLYGGGVKLSDASPTIQNCYISNNSTTSGGSGLYLTTTASATATIIDTMITGNTTTAGDSLGGGIRMDHGGSIVLSGSTVSNNSATYGGGFYVNDSTAGSTSSLTVTDSTFSGNTVTNRGGAIYAASNNATSTVQLTVAGSTITGNESVQGGGGLYLMNNDSVGASMSASFTDATISSNLTTGGSAQGGGIFFQSLNLATITDCTISGNEAVSGAGIYFYNGLAGNVLTLTDSIIQENIAVNGGGMYLSGGGGLSWNPTVERCEILGNTASTQNGAGVYAVNKVPIVFENCVIAGNKAIALHGGGLYLNNSGVSAEIMNCTISGNYAGTSGYGGGICSVNSAVATLTNTIVWGNKAVEASSSDQISGATVTASYSDIGQTGYEGNNNANVDPMFVSPVSYTLAPTTSGDYHLQVDSPVLDVGTATGAPSDDIDEEFRYSGVGYDMGADEVITEVNSAPLLSWTGETNFNSDGVSPDIGADGASFEFRVNYADADNNAPSTLQVWVDKNDDGDYLDTNEKVDLVEVDGGDTTYSDGKIYNTNIVLNYTDNGGLLYRFYADDSIAVATGEPVADNTVLVNDAPTLSWLADAGYDSTDGANPDSDLAASDFVFKIKYTDANNDPPTSIQVWIDKNDDSDFDDAGEMITLAEVDANDTDYTDGKDYTKTVSLTKVGVVASTVLEYRFYASDGSEAVDGAASGDPTSATANTVTVNNNVPALAWTGEVNYSADGVNPDSAVFDSTFEFRVKYTDGDNEPPTTMQLWVDKNNDLSYVEGDGEYIDLVEVDGGDSDYTDGKLYHTSPDITLSTTGNIKYRFYATDSVNDATGTPTSDATVAVTAANDPPVLDWTGEANYTTDGVDPDSNYGGLTFTFRVKYTDAENGAPNAIEVWVDKDDPADGYQADEKIAMTEVDGGDTTYSDGKLYYAEVAVPYVAAGVVPYRFYASDDLAAEATGNDPVSGSNTVTVLSGITVCSSGCNYTTIQGAINAAGDGDSILVAEDTYSENITFPTDARGITVKALGAVGNTIIEGSGANASVVTFSAAAAVATLDGFTIDNLNVGGNVGRGVAISGGATPTIKNCVITGNTPASYVLGAGVYLTGAGATIEDTIIGQSGGANTGGAGAGLYATTSAYDITLTDCTISYNSGANSGGGVYLAALTGTTTISGSSISNNAATNGQGGGLYLTNASATITNTTIDDNSSSQVGGGLCVTGADTASVIMTGGSIDGNSGTNGGGVYLAGGADLDYTNGSISGNTTSGNYGGAVYVNSASSYLDLARINIRGNYTPQRGGGLYLIAGVTTTMENCTVTGNSTVAGSTWQPGGGVNNGGTITIDSCTIAGNYGGNGGGLYNNGTATVTNSIIWGNVAASNVQISGTVAVTESDVEGGWGNPEDNNINSDPSFVDEQVAGSGAPTTAGDFHLVGFPPMAASPCIDEGLTDLTVDIDGGSRPVGGGDDMGSDEYDSP